MLIIVKNGNVVQNCTVLRKCKSFHLNGTNIYVTRNEKEQRYTAVSLFIIVKDLNCFISKNIFKELFSIKANRWILLYQCR